MQLGNSLYTARKKSGLSQEAVAEKLGVSRQTISKRETDETLPDIRQTKHLAQLYHLTLDELVDFNPDQQEIEQIIAHTSAQVQKQIDWTKAWSKQYPILATYQQQVDPKPYADGLHALLAQLQAAYGYSRLDAMLVLKDILAHTWKEGSC